MTTPRRLSDEFWDLRDDAYDAPARWSGVTAEQVFQRLAESVEAAEGAGEIDATRDLSAVLKRWRTQVTGIEPPRYS
ncbi:hypothetical protein HDC94_001289 [Leifsonia sp. AK011]|uniref:hypothetical protein n=1 Tax=Leifsonia sp. AK011 TaxID=2723075 RepID=UPI0015CE8B04|nr:hypothetical protein [Leifsonia sp. AK011]NYF10133.1 hypothetical protein [Leifsonia sp. AK011]